MIAHLVVPVADIRRRLGSRLDVHVTAAFDDLAVGDGAAVPADELATVDVPLEPIFDGVVASGTASAPWEGPCRRCLTGVRGTIEADLREVFTTDPVEGETFPIHGDQVDLEPPVRETVLLSLPLAPPCGEACEGPAPEAFPARVEADGGVDDEDDAPRDPRWAALDDLRFD